MPPRTKSSSSSSSKKSIQQSQPSKFGIQHFFERHTQNALLASSQRRSAAASDTEPSSYPKSKPGNGSSDLTADCCNSREPTSNSVVLKPPEPRNGSHPGVVETNGASQNTPPGDLMLVETDAHASPETSKSVPRKRVKFSPGMLIKQSQDDGGDDVTWRISPVDERLQAVSKRMPEVIKVLAESARHNSIIIRQCSQNKVDKKLFSPPAKAFEASFVSGSGVGLKKVTPCHGTEADAEKNISLATKESPFRTPPSLSYSNSRVSDGVASNEVPDQLGSREHKKTLLELLDQVEGVISADDSVSDGLRQLSTEVNDKSSSEEPFTENSVPRRIKVGVQNNVLKNISDHFFLVLEVSEKHQNPIGPTAQNVYKVLRLVNEQTGVERSVYLWDEWFYSVVTPGDTVNVIGLFDEMGRCNVDHVQNFLIVHPDLLVSGTKVAASFTCSRRTVLDERLRSSEHSTYALIGTLLHQIFQAGLLHESPTVKYLEEYARIVLQRSMESLYACGVNESEMYKTLTEAIPKIVNWAILFKDSQDIGGSSIDFGFQNGQKKVKISEVLDIEEMAWAPKYGLKGMVDAFIKVKVDCGESEADEKIIPLEFKTGKKPSGQSSMEHSAQVILYTLLMSEKYLKRIDFGLLYYLRSDQTQGIAVGRSDLVGLIIRRNELASDILKASTMQQLPSMLQVPSVCNACRLLDVCSIYHKALGGDVETSGLGDLFETKIQHLSDVHFVFLRHWERLVDLEAKEMQLTKKDIWKSHNEKDGHLKNVLTSLVLDDAQNQKRDDDNRFVYRFVCRSSSAQKSEDSNDVYSKSVSSPADDLDCTLKSGDYVTLSTESSNQIIASGFLTDISSIHVSVSFSKRLRIPGSNCSESEDISTVLWRIGKDEIMTSFSTMRFNLIQLFLQNDQSSRLRKMLVDLEAPRFDSGCLFSQDPAVSYVWAQKSLNEDQRRAILKILATKDYALILGMPGTGKTSTMVHAVKALLMRGATILLTSYTNSAVDNLLIKLKAQDIDFIRIGRHESVHEEVKGHCFSAMNIKSVEEIKSRLDQVKVVGVTCLGISSPFLSGKRFDICVMDEAGQTTLPVSLGPLMFASVFVLVGDHYQLPPLVKSTEAKENGLAVSLFRRLSEAHSQAISPLQSQYRMCQGIMDLSNALIYDNRLQCGSSEIARGMLNFTKTAQFCSSWLKDALNPSRPVVFINTDLLPGFEVRDRKAVNNPCEAGIIANITQGLVSNGIEEKDIGIITPYNSQASLIRSICAESVEIHTIDKYQGRDKDCILISFVRSSENPKNCTSTLLGDWHRINVALTRAKKKLIMVGSCATLSKVPLLKLLIDKVKEQSGIICVSKEAINKGQLRRCSEIR